MTKSVLKQIYDCLKENGVDVYFAGQHEGECIKKYTVIKKGGATTEYNVSAERPLYTIMCYVPKHNYSELENYVLEIKKHMKNVYPLVMYLGNETDSFYDETVKGNMVSFQYQGCRKIENSNKW